MPKEGHFDVLSSLDVELKTAHFRPGEALYLAMANVDVDWAGAADAQEKVAYSSIS